MSLHYNNLNNSRWVILIHPRRIMICMRKQPKKIRGGYMDQFGTRYVGLGVELCTTAQYKRYYL